jgi:hypothetical protein
MNRRTLLFGIAGTGGLLLFGCGGSGSVSSSESVPPSPELQTTLWDPSPWLWFIAGESRTIDLAATLPAEIDRGGVFAMSSGSPLPPGFALSPAGILTVTNPAEGKTAGVVFAYTEPGG